MHKTGIETHYVQKQSGKLRCGYTTGTCAAAATQAAAVMLLSGRDVAYADLVTPAGVPLSLEILETERNESYVSCAVRKDAGDDPDITDGMLIFSRVSLRSDGEIRVEGGEGVGRVTRTGLKQPVGSAAINPVPMRMIREQAETACEDYGCLCGMDVLISVPGGKEKAEHTFNPKLGITGGISILGTSGIVVPMSDQALTESIRLEMQMLRSEGYEYLILTPGNYGETFVRDVLHADPGAVVKCSNFVGRSLDTAAETGFRGVLFASHIGKFIKVAGGIMNTHSAESDCRLELMASFAIRAGASTSCARRILDAATTDAALELMETEGLRDEAMKLAAETIHRVLRRRTRGTVLTGAVLFGSAYGELGRTEDADRLLEKYAAQF